MPLVVRFVVFCQNYGIIISVFHCTHGEGCRRNFLKSEANTVESLGTKIRNRRKELGMKQSELASDICTVSMVSQIESDKALPSRRTLSALARRLAAPEDYFLTDLKVQMEHLALFKIACSRIEEQKYSEALEQLELLLVKVILPKIRSQIEFGMAKCYLALQKPEKAVLLLEPLLDETIRTDDPYKTLKTLLLLGKAKFTQGLYPLALYHWHKANLLLSRLPSVEPMERAEVHSLLGDVYTQLGLSHDARRYYEEAKNILRGGKLSKELGELYVRYAASFHESGQFEEAIEYANRAMHVFQMMQCDQMAIDVKNRYATICGEGGQVEKSLMLLAECLQEYETTGRTPEMARALTAMARFHQQSNNLEEAESCCTRAMALSPAGHPELAEVYAVSGTIRIKQGRLRDGIDELQKAADLFEQRREFPSLLQVCRTLSELHQQNGDWAMANQSLERSARVLEQTLYTLTRVS
jgi:tetratricopeptide (TPR) repeat protein